MKKVFIINFILLLLFQIQCYSRLNSVRAKIEGYLKSKKADIGVAVSDLSNADTLTFGNYKHYPMQSVFKFHLALSVLDKVDKGEITLNQKIFIKKSELIKNTWSPIREKYPDGNVELTVSELLEYTVSQSDNIGCDILFKLAGGTKKVNNYIHSLGIKEVSIAVTEAQMHKDWNIQFKNWTTPLAAIQLLRNFGYGKILSESSTEFLYKLMVKTSTGPKRLRGLLPKDAIVAHKTGSSGANDKGIITATNDIGIITLPDGKQFAIAVFVSNSTEDEIINERIIAEIAKFVWDYFLTTK